MPRNDGWWDLRLKDGTVYVFGAEAPVLQSMRDRYGNTTRFTWSANNLWGVGTGNLLKVTSPNGRYLEFTYDASNRVTHARDNIGRTVHYEYDASGRLWKVTDPAGGVTEYARWPKPALRFERLLERSHELGFAHRV